MASSSDDVVLETSLVLGIIMRRNRRRRFGKQEWVRPILQKRYQQGDYQNLLQEMKLCDPDSHFVYLRMSKETFDTLLQKVRYVASYVHRIKIFLCVKVSPHLGKRLYCSKIRDTTCRKACPHPSIFSHWQLSSKINVYSISSVCYLNIC